MTAPDNGLRLVTLEQATRATSASASASEQARLLDIALAAEAFVLRKYGADLAPGTYTRTLDAVDGTVITPVDVTVTLSVRAGSTITGTSHNTAAGLLTVPHTTGKVDVTFTRGPSRLVAEGVLYIIQHAWESEQGAIPTDFQSGSDETFTISRGFYEPNRAKELLREASGYTGVG